MIKKIGKNHYNDRYVQYMPKVESQDKLIIDSDEIVFFKSHGDVVINKYLTHPDRDSFICRDVKYQRPFFFEWNDERYNELFEYNKLYLTFDISGGYRFGYLYFFKDGDDVFCIDESLPLEYGENNIKEQIVDKKYLENLFEDGNYDSMYFIDRESYVKYASSNTDGKILDMDLVLNDEDIVNLDYHNREMNEVMRSMFSFSNDHSLRKIERNSIDEISNLSIFSRAMFHGFYYLFVTSTDGKFDVNWIQVDYLNKDKYKLVLGNVPTMEPSLVYIQNYKEFCQIESAYSPIDDENFERMLNEQKVLRKRKKSL